MRLNPEELVSILGLSTKKLKGKNVLDAKTRKGVEVPVVVGPTKRQLMELTKAIEGKASHETDSLRYIKGPDGKLYVAPAYGFTHDDMAKVLQEAGHIGDDWQFETGGGDRGSHGKSYETGYLKRKLEELLDDQGNDALAWIFGDKT